MRLVGGPTDAGSVSDDVVHPAGEVPGDERRQGPDESDERARAGRRLPSGLWPPAPRANAKGRCRPSRRRGPPPPWSPPWLPRAARPVGPGPDGEPARRPPPPPGECHGVGRVHGQGVGRDGFEEVARQQLIQRFGGAHVTMVEATAASDETNLRGLGQRRPIVVPGAAPRWRVPASRRASGPTPTTMWRWASGRDATGDEEAAPPTTARRPFRRVIGVSSRPAVPPNGGAAFSVQAAAGREPS